MKHAFALVLMCCVASAQASSARPMADDIRQTSTRVTSDEPAFAAWLERYPALEEAHAISATGKVLRQASFRQVDPRRLHALAETLLHPTLTVHGADWVEDADLARRLSGIGGGKVTVYQHRVDGVEVEGSFVVVREHADGSGEVSSSLIPAATPKDRLLAPRQAVQAALGRTSPAESMSGSADTEAVYAMGPDGVARLAYRALTVDGDGAVWGLRVGAEDGRLFSRHATVADIDVAPDDHHWTMPPWAWVGHDAEGNPVPCFTAETETTTTEYYPLGFELPSPRVQVNLTGVGSRMRNPALGLTSIQWWGRSLQEFNNNWPTWTWADVASLIPQKEGSPNCQNATYPPLSGFTGPVPYAQSDVDQHHYLQVAMQDIEARFGWQGLNNQRNPLLLVQNLDPQQSCETHLQYANQHFGMIACGADLKSIGLGQTQRIPPVEVFAHEFGHTVVHDLGLTFEKDFEHLALAEALADMLAVASKVRRGGNPWLLGDRSGYMERVKEEYCESAGGADYCDLPPMLAARDLANPKTMNPLDPSAEFYEGENWLKTHSASGKLNYHGASQVVSHMMYRVAEGAPAGARDGLVANGEYAAFAGIGLQETLEIFAGAIQSLHQVNLKAFVLEEFAEQFRASAIQQCGRWSAAELVSGKAIWIGNLSLQDVDFAEAGYISPLPGAQDVSPLTEFAFTSETTQQKYEFQVATDEDFTEVVHEDSITSDFLRKGRFLLKLEPDRDYWWRVRLANAPMISSKWVVQDEACWRPAAPFRTGGPAQVTNPSPAGATAATGDEVEPWNVVFAWTGHARFDGYEFWVDYEEPEGGKYAKVWAHKLFDSKSAPLDAESPGSVDEPNFTVPPIPLPMNAHLCWKIVPFVNDDQGKRIDGDPLEQCFRTRDPETLITHPSPPAVDGTVASAPAQPLAIDYDPADGSESHEFSLQLLQLSGIDPPPATGQWAYEDSLQSDSANRVVEAANPPDWTTRTRLRMLPVQLDASPYRNYSLNKVRITIKSRSPVISSPVHGGTYPERQEYAEAAVRDFRPADPANFVELHPYITAPPAMGSCTSDENTDLAIEWKHGPDATADVIGQYRVALYPERCSNTGAGCSVLGDPYGPEFAASRIEVPSVKHNGMTSQRIAFSREALFPDEASEDNEVSGFLAHLYGVSGPDPGPANLNITGTKLVDLPVLPAKLKAVVAFEDGGEAHPEWTKFVVFPQTSKNPDAAPNTGRYAPPHHDIDLRVYRGPHCDESQVITEVANHVDIDFEDAGLSDVANPVISARAFMTYPGMACPTLVSDCTTATGTNRQSRPGPVEGLVPREQGGQIGAFWNISADANPESLEYFVGVSAQGNDSSNLLVNHPATVMLTQAELATWEEKIGTHSLALLDPADVGKNVILRVLVCRAGTDKCSPETTALYTVGAPLADGPLPTAPLDLALHFDESGGILLPGQNDPIFQNGWITASWNTPSGAGQPSHYLVQFSSTGAVPGVLPTWLNTLGLSGVDYPANASQYTAVIRALPEGLVLGSTNWGDYVWLLAETHHSAPPATGTWVTAKVWACTGATPLPVLRNHDWILGTALDGCGPPAEVSAQYP